MVMRAMQRAALLLLLGVRGATGYRALEGEDSGRVAPGSLAQRRQLFRRLGTAGKKSRGGAGCVAEVQGGVPAVVLLGGVSEGKSTAACVLSGDPVLARTRGQDEIPYIETPRTRESCIHRTSWFYPYDHSEPLYLIDTPGFPDWRRDNPSLKSLGDEIVGTLGQAGHGGAILLVLDKRNPRLGRSSENALRFARSHYGQGVYERVVVVYTHFKWKLRRARRQRVTGEARVKHLSEYHGRMTQSLLQRVEAEFWPNGLVDPAVIEAVTQLPYYAFNTQVLGLEEEEGGGPIFVDTDIDDDDYDEEDEDGWYGVLNPETFDAAPNSATQLRDLKAKILEISR